MAKKAVATFAGDKSANKNVVKCIRMVRSKKTGSYYFEEAVVPVGQEKEFLAGKKN
ncbi:MAG: DUF4295 family protein [Bacteroidales bacterium]|nr:DUF4295 family protein [Bacteroidales bacterium]MBP5230024.1 DUF4295 family protein [Bacteroidales bacterium]MBR4438013.1 DUF4295 family protein [Bacteroidales bacterium]MBR4806038.1 DUF4295 family protein [Bacteroidales bacterium]MBR4980028.1 DUF4295 family protein [Bacteroidales bacterium]